MHMHYSGLLKQHTLLIIDKDAKQENDRTWCFWQKEPSDYEAIVHHKWQNLHVASNSFDQKKIVAPYWYKMIKGIDFYNHCHTVLKANSNTTMLQANITGMVTLPSGAMVTANGLQYTSQYAFSSILLTPPKLKPTQQYLLQHFKGYVIETPNQVFDAAVATFMDFRVSQQHGTTFCYVLPLSSTKALVEYTLFTHLQLTTEQYNAGLEQYISQQLNISKYTITSTEQGVIPMTDYAFAKADGNIIYIGTAGGNTRGSSGYTFNYIQKHSKALVQVLMSTKHPASASKSISNKAAFFDKVLLNVLARKYQNGDVIFGKMLRKKSLLPLLRFLDDESTLVDDLKVIFSQSPYPFIKALYKSL